MLNVVKKLALTITLFCGYFISFSLHADNASFKKKFIAAEDSIIVENYVGALKILTELNALEPNNANIAFKMGMCYLNSPLQKSKSIPFLEKAAENINPNYSENDYKETKAPDITIQYLAQAYHLANKFDEAIATYEKLKNLYAPSNVQEISSINLKIEMCKTGKDNEAGRQLNRRIECKLLNYDGNDIRMEKIEIPKITPKPETKGKSAPTNKKKSAPKKK